MITEIVEMIANDIKEKFPDEYNDKNLFEDFDKDSNKSELFINNNANNKNNNHTQSWNWLWNFRYLYTKGYG